MRMFAATALSLSLVCLLMSSGCGGPAKAKVAKVSGTVSYKGQPIKSGTIIFEVPGTRQATGKIVDGQITEVTTHDPGDGAPVGQAKIAVFATQAASSGSSAGAPSNPGEYKMGSGYMGAGTASLVPAKFNNPATSGLTAEIKAADNALKLDLQD